MTEPLESSIELRAKQARPRAQKGFIAQRALAILLRKTLTP